MARLDDIEASPRQPKIGNLLTTNLTMRTNAQTLNQMEIPLGIEALEANFSMADYLRTRGISVSECAETLSRNMDKYRSPYQWTIRKKTNTLLGALIAAALAAYAAGAYALASDQLVEEWNISVTEYNIGITTYNAGFAVAPIVLARISESHGRYWVFAGAGVVFFLGTLGCALTNSYAGMLVSRFVAGNGASVFATLTGGIVSDLFDQYHRNTPMVLFSVSIFAGAGLGPLFSGIIVDRLKWTWVFYPQLITIGLTTLCILFFFSETRGNVLLGRKCKALNKLCSDAVGDSEQSTRASTISLSAIYFTPQVGQEQKLSVNVVWTSLVFPMKLLVTEPVVFWFSAWVSFAWSILYMQFSSIGLVFKEVYSFDNTQVGLVYIATIVGSILSAVVNIVQDPILRRLFPGRMSAPEGWLYAACLESFFFPAGLFWFGWSAAANAHWSLPALAVGCCTMGIFNIYLAVFNYLAATYHRYSSSAQAAQSMCRNALGGAFPLFTHAMFHHLGLGIAGTVLGCIGLVLTLVPWLLCFFGERIRARSAFASQLKASDL